MAKSLQSRSGPFCPFIPRKGPLREADCTVARYREVDCIRPAPRVGIHSDGANARVTDPNNYRAPNAPYGYRVQGGKLIVDRSEIRACRLVVNLIGEQQLSANAAAKELERRRIKNRNGLVTWGHYSVQRIFERWKDEL